MSDKRNLSFEMNYDLLAHTPLIHFQHEQEGATLRATEVKPKLDKFLIAKLKDRLPKGWLTGKEENHALNYKLRLRRAEKFSKVRLGQGTDYGIYYGNQGNDRKEKMGIIADVQMTVVCMIPELREHIDKNIAEFFVVTNFGSMQGKGFGSFTVKGKTPSEDDEIGRMLAQNAGASACYAICGYSDKTKIFKDIQTVYSVMKTGHNRQNYHRSYLFLYCHEFMETGNEKAAMKINKVSPWERDGSAPVKNPKNQKENIYDLKDREHKYVRALFGVGETIRYISEFKEGTDRNGRKVFRPSSFETITIKSNEVERAASPILFKVINGTVYIVARRIHEGIYGKTFTFRNKKTKSFIKLSVPQTFDIDKFMAWFVDKYNKESMQKINGRLPSYSIYKTIKTVYKGGVQ